jgi:RND superfamily putative drug exporter
MENTHFFRLGRFIFRHKIAIIVVWLLAIVACMPLITKVTSGFKTTGFTAAQSESDLAAQFLNKNLDSRPDRIVIIYHSPTLKATDAQFTLRIKKSLAELKRFPIKHDILYPDRNSKQTSKNKHTAYVVIVFRTQKALTSEQLQTVKNLIKPPEKMSLLLGGESIFIENINSQIQRDLMKSDLIAAPISIIILFIIFGTFMSALIPMILGGGCAILILTLLYALSQSMTLSIFTLNIALLLGLCLSLDYALFIISRFRDELRSRSSCIPAIANTLATAGRAVFFSGITVFISLSALLLFPINILFSIGVGGLVAVFVAAAAAVTLLPAVLCVLQQKINWGPVRRMSLDAPGENIKNNWYLLAVTVVKRPWFFFIAVLFVLLVLSYPLRYVVFGISDSDVLPVHSSNQQFFDTYKKNFNPQSLAPIEVVVRSPNENILSKHSISALYDYVQKLKKLAHVSEISSIVNLDKPLEKKQYQKLYHDPKKIQDKRLKQLLATTTRVNFTVIDITSKYAPDSKKTIDLIKQLRQIKPAGDLKTYVTGTPAINADVLEAISKVFYMAAIWIIVLTYLILLMLLQSLFLPLKALFMNIFSLCASYGVLVFIFQEGHLHDLLNFKVQGMLDISLVIIIFCALFGFSMDYEIFLLTRIQECYKKTQDNQKSIIYGIVKSSWIITSAAMIVIFICASFMFADVLMVKEFGLGIAVAIFVDAFAIRTVLVPATMTLLKKINWYFPKWLGKYFS